MRSSVAACVLLALAVSPSLAAPSFVSKRSGSSGFAPDAPPTFGKPPQVVLPPPQDPSRRSWNPPPSRPGRVTRDINDFFGKFFANHPNEVFSRDLVDGFADFVSEFQQSHPSGVFNRDNEVSERTIIRPPFIISPGLLERDDGVA
ncbi:hypothetical protein B0F90DRAFT_1822890 [Multifurca ochricompacta]|uniref:Uncharacterized protein n=1 Tax=Multifurca ochricompacta TaxID=376703 RepID=A0AAD4LY88_9AGAM|nr:hypothetical protein B0F90DRAFT_1822890 [Multifurca ochricompacta]